jgi:hypothetical protein
LLVMVATALSTLLCAAPPKATVTAPSPNRPRTIRRTTRRSSAGGGGGLLGSVIAGAAQPPDTSDEEDQADEAYDDAGGHPLRVSRHAAAALRAGALHHPQHTEAGQDHSGGGSNPLAHLLLRARPAAAVWG